MFDKIKNLFAGRDKVHLSETSILIVDDSEVDRKVIESALIKHGFKTITARNGQEGLDLAKAKRPSLIVLDCEMPVMNGPDMCQHLKNDEATERIPVLFLTSIDTPKNIVECFQLDAENFLSKPVNVKVLTSQIDQILRDLFKK